MAAITSTAHTKINSVIFVESLADDEMHTGTWVHEDLAAYLDCLPIHHEFHTVRDRIGLFLLLNQLRDRARDQHLRPIIHIDAHGSEDKTGVRVLPSGDVVPWADLAGLFRNINRETLNNLVVVMSMCYGFRGIVPVGIDVAPRKATSLIRR